VALVWLKNEDICFEIGETMQNICNNLEIPFVFKASYKKANRTSINSFKGLGDKHGLDILKKNRKGTSIAYYYRCS
jgi:2-dehydro-3-deoxyphosphooctonate aldolase (KDO 8-P synthase)